MTDIQIYPIFIGDYWSTQAAASDRFSVIIYLADLSFFINGVNAPANQKPYLAQYGIGSAALNTPVTVGWPNGQLSDASIVNEIWNLQQAGQLPLIGNPNTLFVVFPGTGITPGAGAQVGYHKDFRTTFSVFQEYAVAFKGANVSQSLLSSHEIQEAATDPFWNFGVLTWAVDASHELCDDATCGNPPGTYESFTAGVTIIGCADNTQGGRCTTTGYIPK